MLRKISWLKFISAIAILMLSVIYVLIIARNNIIGPWTFAFLIDPFEVPSAGQGLWPQEFTQVIHERSPLTVAFSHILQEVVGLKFQWISLPGIAFYSIILYSLLDGVDRPLRIIIIFASVGGPVGIFFYHFILLRGAVTTITILTFILILRISIRQEIYANLIYIPIIFGFFSLVVWLFHYSVWPFYFIICMMTLVFYRTEMRFTEQASAVLLLLMPLALYIQPAIVLVSSTSLVLELTQWDLSLLLSPFSVSSGSIPPGVEGSIIERPLDPRPVWMPEVQYIAYLPVLCALSLIWAKNHLSSGQHVLEQERNRLNFRWVVLISVTLAFIVTSIAYILRGYLTRIVIFWPIVIPLFFEDLLVREVGSINTHDIINIRNVVIFLIVTVSVIHLLPIFTPGFYDADQRSTIASPQQVHASEWATYTQGDKPIYTDLLHASNIITHSSARHVVTGTAYPLNSTAIFLDERVAILYNSSSLDGYVLVSTSNTLSVRTSGSAIPAANKQGHHTSNSVYDNGADNWYYRVD